ncbi:unnamed protein product [Notodromas monacha]|uniref:Methyltransferase-like protein 4 n=1 Tax=Notodromas monacha TaxID=399045 RepID=A0A7R9BQ11_9CRUS|nr:unnamed protein product [Notodromas monacha]CAG0918716.1 unnamed protein product [Notodromas monacha]
MCDHLKYFKPTGFTLNFIVIFEFFLQMAVLHIRAGITFTDHLAYLKRITKDSGLIQPNPDLFMINTPFRMYAEAEKYAKAFQNETVKPISWLPPMKSTVGLPAEEFYELYREVEELVREVRSQGKALRLEIDADIIRENNQIAIASAVRTLQSCLSVELMKCFKSGENDTDEWLKMDGFFLPPKCKFICADWDDFVSIDSSSGPFYNFVVVDPPWMNKSVRRVRKKSRSYSTMVNYHLLKLCSSRIMAPGCLLAVWCPPVKSQMTWVQDNLLPAWNCKLKGTWYWFKVTQSGEPVKPWSPKMTWENKKSFEVLFIATYGENDVNIPREHVIVSVPSAIHSHKPPLEEFILDDGKSLEIYSGGLCVCPTMLQEVCSEVRPYTAIDDWKTIVSLQNVKFRVDSTMLRRVCSNDFPRICSNGEKCHINRSLKKPDVHWLEIFYAEQGLFYFNLRPAYHDVDGFIVLKELCNARIEQK